MVELLNAAEDAYNALMLAHDVDKVDATEMLLQASVSSVAADATRLVATTKLLLDRDWVVNVVMVLVLAMTLVNMPLKTVRLLAAIFWVASAASRELVNADLSCSGV